MPAVSAYMASALVQLESDGLQGIRNGRRALLPNHAIRHPTSPAGSFVPLTSVLLSQHQGSDCQAGSVGVS